MAALNMYRGNPHLGFENLHGRRIRNGIYLTDAATDILTDSLFRFDPGMMLEYRGKSPAEHCAILTGTTRPTSCIPHKAMRSRQPL
jgi:hypothetical protein